MRKENVLGIVFILAGVAWIIEITGLVSINWVESFRTLWPVIFVAIGISMMARRKKSLNAVVWLLTLAIFTGYGVYKGNEPGINSESNSIFDTNKYKFSLETFEPFEKEVAVPEGTEKGKIILNLGAVKLNLSDGSRDLFVKVNSNIPDLKQRFSEGKQSIMEYSRERHDNVNTIRDFNLQMNPGLLWEIEGNIGAADGRLDLTSVPTEKVSLTIGAGDLEVVVGKQDIDTEISVRAGAADLDVYIPRDAGLRVKSEKFLTDINFHNISMEKNHNEYISENFKDADQIIELNIYTAISAINIFSN